MKSAREVPMLALGWREAAMWALWTSLQMNMHPYSHTHPEPKSYTW